MFKANVLALATTNAVSKQNILHTANNQKRNVGMARNDTIKPCMPLQASNKTVELCMGLHGWVNLAI